MIPDYDVTDTCNMNTLTKHNHQHRYSHYLTVLETYFLTFILKVEKYLAQTPVS